MLLTDQHALERTQGGVLREVSILRTGLRAEVSRCTLVRGGGSVTVIVKSPVGNEALLQHESAGLRALAGLAVPKLLAVLPSGALVLEDPPSGIGRCDGRAQTTWIGCWQASATRIAH
jgi:hypothetical protein